MNSRLLLAFCCFVAVAQARPKSSDSSSCSLTCKERNFWQGYAIGSTYKYSFEQEVEINSQQSEQKSLVLKAIGEAEVEVHSACEMVLRVTMTDSKVSASANEPDTLQTKEAPLSLKEALKEPLRFSFDNGRITQLCPRTGDTRASLNIKRAILSQLQISIEDSKQQGMIKESDILGDCVTAFKYLGDNKIEKRRDLSTCTSSYEVYPSQGVKLQQQKSMVFGTSGELVCTMDLEGDRVKSSECKETRTMKKGKNDKGLSERVISRARLELQGSVDGLESLLEPINSRSDLQHEHKDGSDCQNSQLEEQIFQLGSECLERKQLKAETTSAKQKEQASAVLNELCTMSKADEISGEMAQKMAELIKYMRGITEVGDLDSLVNTALSGDCMKNEIFKATVFSSLASAGTKQSVRVILDNTGRPKFGKSSIMSEGVATMPHPSPEVIRIVLDSAKEYEEEEITGMMATLDNQRLMALSMLVGRYCSDNEDCESNADVKEAIDYVSKLVGPNCSFKVDGIVDSAMAAVGNMGRIKGGVDTLLNCAVNETLSTRRRAFALQALRRFPSLSPEQKNRLASIVLSNSYDSELRIFAYKILAKHADMSYRNSPKVAAYLSKLLMNKTQDLQVKLFVYSHLRSLINVKGRRVFAGTIESVVRRFERIAKRSNFFGLGYSKYLRTIYKLPEMSLDAEATIIYSSQSPIPRYVSLNLTTDVPLTGESVNVFELGVRTQGIDNLAEMIYNMIHSATGTSATKNNIRKRRQAEITSQQAKLKPKEAELDPMIDIISMKKGMQYRVDTINSDAISMASVILNAMKSIKISEFANDPMVMSLLQKIQPKPINKAGVSKDFTVTLPSISGFPVVFKTEVYHVVNVAFEPKLEGDVMSLAVKPSASIHSALTVSIDAGFERAGIRLSTNARSSTGLKFSLVANTGSLTDFKLSFKVESLKKRQQVIDLQTKGFFFRHDGEKEVQETPLISESDMKPVQKECTDAFFKSTFGRELCIESSIPTDKYPKMWIGRIPGKYSVYADKSDGFGSFEATASFKRANDENADTELLLLLGDKTDSSRHLRLFYERNSEADSRRINFEITNPFLPIKWNSEAKFAEGGGAVNANLVFGSKSYVFNGTRSIISDEETQLKGALKESNKDTKGQLEIKYGYYGMLLNVLPMTMVDVRVTTAASVNVTFNHIFKVDDNEMAWRLGGNLQKPDAQPIGVKSRIELKSEEIASGKRRSSFVYDYEIRNSDDNNLFHNFEMKVERSPMADDNTRRVGVTVRHSFKSGVDLQPSKLNFEATLLLDEKRQENSLEAKGSGEIKFESGETPVARLSDLVFFIGEGIDEIDGHDDVKKISLGYGLDLAGKKSNFKMVAQMLPKKSWSVMNQCFKFMVDVTEMSQDGQSKQHMILLKNAFNNYEPGVPQIDQAFVLKIANRQKVSLKHSLRPVEGVSKSFAHFFEYNKFAITNTYKNSDSSHELLTEVAIRQTNVFSVRQTVTLRTAAESLPLEVTYNADIVYKQRVINVTVSETMSEQTGKNFYQLINSAVSRKATPNMFFKRLVKAISELKLTRKIEIKTDGYDYSMQSEVDFAKSTGDIIVITAKQYGTEIFNLKINREATGSELSSMSRVYKVTVVAMGVKKELEASMTSNSDGTTCTTNHVIKYSKDDTLMYHLEVDNEVFISTAKVSAKTVLSCKKGSAIFGKDKPYTATAAFEMEKTVPTQPKVTIDLTVTMADDRKASVKYTLDYTKKSAKSAVVSKVDSLLDMSSNLAEVRLPKFSSQVIYQADEEIPFKYAFINLLNDQDLLTEKLELTQSGMVMSVKSAFVGEFEYVSAYESIDDGSYKMANSMKIDVSGQEVSYTDEGQFRLIPRSEDVLFGMEYTGTTQFVGADTWLGKKLGMNYLKKYGLEKIPMFSKLIVNTNGEFDGVMKFDKEEDEKVKSFASVAAAFNSWPFKLRAQLGLPFKNYENLGINVNASGTIDKFNSYLWLGAPFGVNELSYEHTRTDESFVSNSRLRTPHPYFSSEMAINTNFQLQGGPKGAIVVSRLCDTGGITCRNGSFTLSVEFSQTKQFVELKGKNENEEMVLFVFDNTLRLGNNDVQSDFKLFIGDASRPDFFNATGGFLVGPDFYVAVNVQDKMFFQYLNNVPVMKVDAAILFVNSGKNYEILNAMPVEGSNLGFFALLPVAKLYFLRSGNAPTYTYNTKYVTGQDKVVASTTVEVSNGKVTSGSGMINDVSVTFSSTENGVINVQLGTSAGTITYTGTKDENGYMKTLELKAQMQEKEKCFKYSRESNLISASLGDCSNPATISVNWELSNTDALATFAGKFSGEFNLPASFQSKFSLLKASINISEGFKKQDGEFSATIDSYKYTLSENWDIGSFPSAVSFSSQINSERAAKTEPLVIFSYDVNKRTMTTKSQLFGKFNLNANSSTLIVEIGEFKGTLSVLDNQVLGDATGIRGLEFNAQVTRYYGYEPYTIRLWKGVINGGIRMAGEVKTESGKEVSIAIDLVDWELSENEFKFTARCALRDTLANSFSNVNTETVMTFKRDPDASTYSMTYNEKVTYGGSVMYDMKSTFNGKDGNFPSEMKIEFVEGYFIAELSYDFNDPSNKAAFIRYKQEKFITTTDSYLMEFKLNTPIADTDSEAGRGFSLDASCPYQQMYLSKESEITEGGSLKTVVKVYYDKRRGQGVMVTATKGTNADGEYLRNVEVQLPMRVVGYNRKLKLENGKIGYDLVIFWDMGNDVNKNITINYNLEVRAGLSGLTMFNQKVKTSSPLLKNALEKQLVYTKTTDGFNIVARVSHEPQDNINITIDFSNTWNNERRAYQKQFSLTFRRKMNEIKADFKVTADSKHLGRSRMFSPWKYLTVYNIYSSVPHRSIDRHYRIRSVPFEELTLASNSGATFSYRFYRGFARSILRLFVSNTDKEAAKLIIMVNRARPSWKLTLSRGEGYVNPKTSIGVPSFEKQNILVRGMGGLSRCGTKIYHGVIFGEMPADSKYSLWKLDDIPDQINFIFMGLRVQKPNSISYEMDWRLLPEAKMPMTYIREEIIDRWINSRRVPFSPDAIAELMSMPMESQLKNLDTQRLMELLQDIASREYDGLRRWTVKKKEENPKLASLVQKIVSRIVRVTSDMNREMRRMRLPQPERIRMARLPDFSAASPLSTGVRRLEFALQKFARKAVGLVKYLRKSLRSMKSNQGRGYGGFKQFEKVAVELAEMQEKFNSIMDAMYYDLGLNLLTLVADPIYDMSTASQQMLEKINSYKESWDSLVQLIGTDDESPREDDKSDEYAESLKNAVSLFLNGQFDKGMEVLKTDLHKFNEWRSCDAECFRSGSYASYNGTVHLPFYITTFRRKRNYQIGSFSDGYRANYADKKTPVLLRMHKEAQVSNTKVVTFDGRKITRMGSCKYLMAHDYNENGLSVYQSYEWAGGKLTRGDLLINFGSFKVAISPNNEVTNNEVPISNTEVKDGEFEMSTKTMGSRLLVEFHGKLRSALIVRCNSVTSKCRIKLNPFYFNKVNGLFGNNDRNPSNDFVEGKEAKHLGMWSTNSCVAA